MKIINQKPPIFEEAHRYFDIDDSATIYTWGDIIYNPASISIGREYIEHESVHGRQQKEIGGPEIWWRKYFDDPVFRVNQEAEAYGRQHAYYCREVKDRNRRARHLHLLATVLSSPMYKVGMKHSDAMTAIRKQASLPHKFS